MTLRTALLVGLLAFLPACQAETFTAIGAARVEVVHGPPPLVSLGTFLDTLLVIRIVDDRGDPVANVPLRWQVIDGDGEVIPIDSLSDVDGYALARWKFRLIPGLQRVQVRAPGLEPATFVTEARGFRATQISAGWRHGCGIDVAGGAWCWGGDSLELGNPAAGFYTLRPTPVVDGHTFAEVRSGDWHSCGRTASGEVWCWGYNWSQALGQTTPSLGSPRPLRVPGLPAMTLIRAGDGITCGLAVDATTWCWGDDRSGQAGGVGDLVGATQVATGLVFTDLAVGLDHSCGVTAAGTAYCWGNNANGALGDSGASRNAPAGAVQGGHTFLEIHASERATCARDGAGSIWCWGAGMGLAEMRAGAIVRVPVRIALPGPASSFAAGNGWIAAIGLGGRPYYRDGSGAQLLAAPFDQIGIAQVAGAESFCVQGRAGDIYCSGQIVDQVDCSSLPPWGCAPTGPIPLPAGGRVYGYPPFGS